MCLQLSIARSRLEASEAQVARLTTELSASSAPKPDTAEESRRIRKPGTTYYKPPGLRNKASAE